MKTVFLCEGESSFRWVYSTDTIKRVRNITDAEDKVYTKADVMAEPQLFSDTEYIFSTWGMPVFTTDEIKAVFPALKCVFYGAGSVQGFAVPFLECGVKVFSAWAANGVPVAEFTVAQIILANKGFFAASRHMSVGDVSDACSTAAKYPGNFGGKVGIIGVGMIGKMVIRMLREYRLKCVVYDKFLPEDGAAELGVSKCSLEELFAECDVVSNHLANNPQTKGVLTGELFAKMKPYATFINTGRGAQVVEDELCDVLRDRPDITVLLDVTDPEPPVKDSPFYALSNCILTPHIAGSKGNEVHRMSEYMIDEFCRYISGEPCLYEVTLKMLETMA
ncbi:MAG: hydroxyacid dehydrogenase [Ruminococcaceae bacterium]|nr:hydroxyacid dehydrogenase [Oscillospiraceae bacterium]